MDLFLYNPTYQVWICTGPYCQYAVSPLTLLGHLRTCHRSYPTVATPALCQVVLTQMLQQPWGHGCLHCPYICRSLALLHKHRAQKHQEQEGHQGQGWLLAAQAYACARVRLANRVPSPLALSATPQTPTERIRAHVPSLSTHPTKVSPWLELTRWPEYLRGQDLTAVALLSSLPNPAQEPLLALFSASVERLINTFFHEPGVWNQPIQIYLRPKTYRQYYQVWQRLVCFAYHSTQPDQPIQLRHQLNTAQLAALDQMEEYGRQFLALHAKGPET
ncbi:hypothetical protein IFM46972_11324 [Aspergillus udagawae]|uniref:Uncharacterized protein n=1 Tax=Aspergillus udagawae TaxID=91492 RepID=A0A8H3SGV8_9EURO|nr:hypothetical protein IFM46972_11324 [Aspergillus udagawae]